MTIERLHAAFSSKQSSPLTLSKKLYKRIKQNKELNALTTVNNSKCLSQAHASTVRYENGRSLTSFDGIPFVVKDNFCTDGIATTCSSKMLQNFHPPYSATVVQRLLDSGGILIGKTNMDEFAMGCGSIDGQFGSVRNPWSPDINNWNIAGGSSGGSAVAVAAGLAVAAISSDTGGSTRNPSSYCGVVGLKPTYGRVSRHGLIPLVNALDVPGIITRSVKDSASVFNIVNGHDPKDSTSLIEPKSMIKVADNMVPLRVGIPIEYHAPGMISEVASTWDLVAGWLSDAGFSVERVSLPHTQHSIKCYSVLCCAEVASNMARYDGVEFGHRARGQQGEFISTEHLYAATRREGFNSVVRGRILAGNYFLLRENLDRYLHRAQRIWRLVYNDFVSVFKNVDVLLTPVTLSDAPLYSDFSQENNQTRISRDDVCTQPINLAGVPSVTLPIKLSSRGLPLSLQLVGPQCSEQNIINVAFQIETRAQFKQLYDFDSLWKSL